MILKENLVKGKWYIGTDRDYPCLWTGFYFAGLYMEFDDRVHTAQVAYEIFRPTKPFVAKMP